MTNLIGFFEGRVKEGRYQKLRSSFRAARIAKSPEEYLHKIILVSIVFGLVGFFVVFISFPILAPVIGLVSAYACYRIGLIFPSLKAKSRGEEIDRMFPHAAAFMLAMSKGGFGLVDIFRSLSERKEYGEISKEGSAIVRDVERLGYSPIRAIEDVAESTPSERLSDFLLSLASAQEAGADLPELLSEKCERYYSEAEEEGRRLIDDLITYAVGGLMLLGIGSIVLILTWFPLNMVMGRFIFLPIQLLVYLGIPVGTIVFLALLDKFSFPTIKRRNSTVPKEMIPPERLVTGPVNRMKRSIGSLGGYFSERPVRTFLVGVPLSIIFGVLIFILGFRIETAIVFGALVLLLPFIVFYERRRRKVERIIGAIPGFLSSFSDFIASGLSPSRSIEALPSHRFPGMEEELREMKRDLRWGDSLAKVLYGFERKVKSGLLLQVVSVVERASKMGSRIGDVLEVLTSRVSSVVSLRDERGGKTSSFVWIIYLIFLMSVGGFGLLLIIFESMAGVPAPGGGLELTPIPMDSIKVLFFHAVLILGFCFGVMTGKIRSGSLLDGLKHSVIMLFLGWLMFTLAPL